MMNFITLRELIRIPSDLKLTYILTGLIFFRQSIRSVYILAKIVIEHVSLGMFSNHIKLFYDFFGNIHHISSAFDFLSINIYLLIFIYVPNHS